MNPGLISGFLSGNKPKRTLRDILQKLKQTNKHPTQTASLLQTQSKLQSLSQSQVTDDPKPWQFVFTSKTFTLSWVSFSILIVLVCCLGGLLGSIFRKYRTSDGNSHLLKVNADAAD